MWMSASMLVTRMFNWPLFHRPMVGYQQTIPGQISGLIGASLPSAFTGIVLGPIGPFAVAAQQMALSWGLAYDAAIAKSHDTHPEWTDEERRAVAGQAADAASKLPGIVALGLGLVVLAIAWLTWPRLKRSKTEEPKTDGLSLP